MKVMHDRVCLIDDEESVRTSMGRLLVSAGFTVEMFESADSYLNAKSRNLFTCIILDHAMPGLSGMELQKTLNVEENHIPIIFLTAHADVHLGVEAMQNGALDYLIKPVDKEILFAAVNRAFAVCRMNIEYKTDLDDINGKLASLTSREKEVLGFLTSGAKNRDIASALDISEKTVKIHRANIMKKMRASTPAELGYRYASHLLKMTEQKSI